MNILLTAYEVEPFYKRGGLGEVMGALPKALSKLGVDARVIMPYYTSVQDAFPEKEIASFTVRFDGQLEKVKIREGTFPHTKIPVYFLENRQLMSIVDSGRKKIEQFIFFDLAVGGFIDWLIEQGTFIPDIVHCQDWHTALIPVILKARMKLSIPTLLTIHNHLYQGQGSLQALNLLNIDEKDLRVLRKDSPTSELNTLEEGILRATYLSTVSEKYAREIEEEKKGNQVYGFLQQRKKEKGKDHNLYGIINGIDYKIWDPYNDKKLFRVYNRQSVRSGKLENKTNLLYSLKLKMLPTFAFVGRMAEQKGLDVIAASIDVLMKKQINIIFLGSGNKGIQEVVESMQKKYPNNIRCFFKFDETMAHRLYAASDFIFIPSHYEPCGLIQMIAMRYGAIPIANDTGGLHDSIENEKDGYLFHKDSQNEFVTVFKKALDVFEKNPKKHQEMMAEAMKKDFSWAKSATQYKKLYEKIIKSAPSLA